MPPAEVGARDADQRAERRAEERGPEAPPAARCASRRSGATARRGRRRRCRASAAALGRRRASRRSRSSSGSYGARSGARTRRPAISRTMTRRRSRRAAAGGTNSATAARQPGRRPRRPATLGQDLDRRVDRHRSQRYRIRGSSHAYARSTRKLTTMNDRRDQHDQGLGQRVVAVRDRLDEQQAEAVQVEHLLGDHEPAEQERELEADHGQHRQHRVLQRVAREDQLRPRAPWRARCGCSPRAAPRASPSGSCGWPPPSSDSRPRAPAR